MHAIYRSLRHSTGGSKRRFGAAGLSNVLLTNLLLQLLLHNSVSVAASTFVAQLFNAGFGYLSYGKFAFRSSLWRFTSAGRYVVLASGLWILNWTGIQGLGWYGVSKSLAAVVMIPALAILSFLVQSNWVFKKQ